MTATTLKDLLSAHNRQISIESIERTVAEFYKIKVADLHSKKRNSTGTAITSSWRPHYRPEYPGLCFSCSSLERRRSWALEA